ncbi:MAG: HAD family hydrolase [candidate division KSB1 bacterium]|nr:HAD family hydrolase [candidate division KSB1 bacterium]MDZ7333631.1 HAD family hydrolase [candidate division KSB1 bacterium]MDZ7357817.1 HAD family hydrolase [candidate division KSB1 bacterium]MDZ7398745.1 HAD family hydrolase [candidate division KSB1 bacterium]
MKLQAVLFDLDNTLILFEELVFFKHYSQKLYAAFADLMTPQEFSGRLIHSTQMMIQNNGELTNAEFFIQDFANGTGADERELWQRFAKFYEQEFEQFQPLMQPHPDGRDVIQFLKSKKLKIVIASNPMFPTHVQLARLRWAGLGDIEFDLITSAENTTYVKPRLEYYQQICERIAVPADCCVMVGNDPFNDMIAAKIGMKTYLTTDTNHLSIELSRELAKNANLEMPKPDFSGPLSGLKQAIEQLLQEK